MDANYLFEKTYNELFISALRITGNITDAKDLISESFIDIVERKKKPPTNQEEFVKWMTTYLKFHYLSKYGRFKKQKTGTEKPIDTWKETVQEEDSEPRILSVRQFKTTLDALDKILFELIYEKELSYSEINKLYGIKKHILHGLTKQLKQKINDTKCLKLYRLSDSGMVICRRSSSDTMGKETNEHRLRHED